MYHRHPPYQPRPRCQSPRFPFRLCHSLLWQRFPPFLNPPFRRRFRCLRRRLHPLYYHQCWRRIPPFPGDRNLNSRIYAGGSRSGLPRRPPSDEARRGVPPDRAYCEGGHSRTCHCELPLSDQKIAGNIAPCGAIRKATFIFDAAMVWTTEDHSTVGVATWKGRLTRTVTEVAFHYSGVVGGTSLA